MDEPPRLPESDKQNENNPESTFYHQAAACCLWAPFIAIGVNVMSVSARRSSEALSFLVYLPPAIMVIGFILGVVSLFGIRKHGRKGIVGRAVTGIVIFLVLAGLAVPALLMAKKRAREKAEQIAARIRAEPTDESFSEARAKYSTKLIDRLQFGEPAAEPPPELFRLVKYQSKLGPMDAYLGVDPKDGKRHPAIIWKFGGFSNSIGETAWEEADPGNDQSARAFRETGIVMMYPSVRGGNSNPGFIECGFGEIDDLLAAAEFLKAQPYVDPRRIYLGGHSTGGTLALLTAAASKGFRAVFALGPAASTANYGQDNVTFDVTDRTEAALRAPIAWLHEISTPTFVFEGTVDGNVDALRLMARRRQGVAKFYPIKGQDHFSIIAPLTKFLARKILADTGSTASISITPEELAALF